MTPSNLPVQELKRMIRFGLIGIVNTGVDIGIFSVLFFVLGMPLLVANSIGYLASLTGSFFLNKNWTFAETKTQGRTGRQYLLFAGLGLGGLALSNLTVWSLRNVMPVIMCKLVSVVGLFAWNYGTSRMIVFRTKLDVQK